MSDVHDELTEADHRRPVGERKRWLTVARKDFADAGRSWQLYVLGGVFTTAMTFGGLGPILRSMARSETNPHYSVYDGLIGMADVVGIVVPLVALFFGHMAIAGELERGSLRTLLAFPLTRRDVVIGTLFGRIGVVSTTLLLGLGLAGVSMWWMYDDMPLIAFSGFAATVLLFAACFVAMGVGISAASRTRGTALAWAVGAFSLTTILWDLLLGLQQIVTDVSPVNYMGNPDQAPGWYVFLARSQPAAAWRHVVSEWVVPLFPNTRVGRTRHEPPLTTPGQEPFYIDEWVLLGVMLAWGIVPLLIGYWRFRHTDIT